MSNFLLGLGTIFCGGVIGMVVRYIMPVLVTGTEFADVILTNGVPIALFFIMLILGLFIMIGRRGRGQQQR